MSTISQLTILALASAVLATPYAGHGHGHAHAHRNVHSGSAASWSSASANCTGYAGANSTGVYTPSSTPKAPPYVSATGYDTVTSHVGRTSTIYQTVTKTLEGTTAASDCSATTSNVPVSPASASDVCDMEVTVTSTEKVYVTVTAGEVSSSAPAPAPYVPSSSVVSPVESSSAPISAASAPSYSAPAYSAPSSSEAAPVPSSVSSPAAPAYTPSSESSSVAAPVTTSSPAAPAYTPTTESSSSSTPAAVIPSTYASSTASAPASYSSAPASGGKRGLAYNDADLTKCFSGSSQISWGYNWVASSGGLTGYSYIPTLHSSNTDFTGSWSSDAQEAIGSGSTTLFSFNEPDIASQANLDVGTAVSLHKQYMAEFKGKAKVCAPSVSSSESPNQGLDYLQQFLDQCNGSDCPVDCLNIHWYSPIDSSASSAFISHVKQAVGMLKDGQTLYVSEFGATSGSDSDISSFLEDVMSYMDGESAIAGYAYFMVESGKLVNGEEPSSYGSTYMNYSS